MEEGTGTSRFLRLWAVGAALLIAAGISAAIFLGDARVANYFVQGYLPEAWGTLLGQMTIDVPLISLGVWAVLHFGFVRWTVPDNTAAYFLMILGVVLVVAFASVGVVYYSLKHRYAAVDDTERAAGAELDRAFAGVRNVPGQPIDMRVADTGEQGALDLVVKRFVAARKKVAADYFDARAALDYPAFVSPARLAAKGGLAAAPPRLEKLREAVKQMGRDGNRTMADVRAALDKAIADPARREAIKRQITSRMATDNDLMVHMMAEEDSAFLEWEDAVEDLKHAHGRFLADGAGKMRFADPRDIETYNGHVRTLMHIRDEERALEPPSPPPPH